jgi:tRNA(Ser,Leu) C12 N-acetylase TAN1
MSSSGKPSGKKRQWLNHDTRNKKNHYNPKRGGPAVLLTAETGREFKCQREGLEILSHYCAAPIAEAAKENEGTSLSLEDELKILKSKKGNSHPGFAVYETGCRGTIFILRTTPGCNLIPPVKVEHSVKDKSKDTKDESESGPEAKKPRVEDMDPKPSAGDATATDESTVKDESKDTKDGSESGPEAKKPRVEDKDPKPSAGDATATEEPTKAPWDPIETVRTILSDLEKGEKKMPSSRFVQRMIPLQATCFASIDEIRATAQALMIKFFPPKAKTFAIAAKRRNNGNLKRDQIIDTVAGLVLASNPDCKVNLDNPEVTIIVEVCKTLCGISIVPSCDEFKNFNLVMVREQQDQEDEEAEESKSS